MTKKIEALIAQATARNTARTQRHEAFGEIVKRFQGMAYNCAYATLGDFQLAEDAAQEAFIEAYRNLPKLREVKAFSSWFKQIVLRQCHRITRRKSLPIESIESVLELPSDEKGPAMAAEKNELKEKVLAAIKDLPENERMVTTLFYLNGYSQKDIAGFLKVSVTKVNNCLRSSRKRLKERLGRMVGNALHEWTCYIF